MTTTTSDLFEYFERYRRCEIIRHQTALVPFSQLRKNIILIIKDLFEIDSSTNEIGSVLRARLSEWLTTPILFDEKILKEIESLGTPFSVSRKWGSEIGKAYEAALKSAGALTGIENPIRSNIRDFVADASSSNKRIKIFCHKQARGYFESILSSVTPHLLENDCFLHNPKDYSASEPFDILIKVGPLRPRGWGGVPDAILTVPRYNVLAQFVWSGSKDEEGFGFDPVAGTSIIDELETTPTGLQQFSSSSGINWTSTEVPIAESISLNYGPTIDTDEFQIFKTLASVRTDETRSAVLLQIDGSKGILYPERSPILSFDAGENESIAFSLRSPDEELLEEMFLIIPIIDKFGVGNLQAGVGNLSPKWKQFLIVEFEKNTDRFCDRLFDSGLELLGLKGRINHWCKSSTTVIPAPQKRSHFEILMKELDLFSSMNLLEQNIWIEHAWQEVRRSRGEAITDGRIVQEILDTEILNALKTTIGQFSIDQNSFQINIPSGHEIQGYFRFYKILAIEKGYCAPDDQMRTITEYRDLEQWRL